MTIWILATLIVSVLVATAAIAWILLRSRVEPDPNSADVAPRQSPASVSAAFGRSVSALTARVRGVHPLRDVPWLLSLGPESAGRAMLWNGLHTSEDAQTDGVQWHLLRSGAIIEVPPSTCLPESGMGLENWRVLLRLLLRHRPRRPLDALLLTIPAAILRGDHAAVRGDTLAVMLRARILECQSELGFALPVYILITDAEEIPGFLDYSDALPAGMRQNILGWSSPYAPGAPFDPAWVEEGMQAIYRGLVVAQLGVFAGRETPRNPGEVLSFPLHFTTLLAPLQSFLGKLLRPTAYDASPMFRGIYLCGRQPDPSLPTLFLQDLLDEKIFPERGLAIPLSTAITWRNRQTRVARVVAAVLALILTVGTAVHWRRLKGQADDHRDFLVRLKNGYSELKSPAGGRRDLDPGTNKGYSLAKSMFDLRLAGMTSPFFPASWVYRPEEESSEAFRIAFTVILDDFRKQLEARGFALAALPTRAQQAPAEGEGPAVRSLEENTEYRQLREFRNRLRAYALALQVFNELASPDTGSLGEFTDLAAYLTEGTSLPPLRPPDEPYATALKSTTARSISCSQFGLNNKLSLLLNEFSRAWLGESNPVEMDARRFSTAWTAFVRSNDSLPEVYSVLNRLSVTTGVLAWMGGDFDPQRYPGVSGKVVDPRAKQAVLACIPDFEAEVGKSVFEAHEKFRHRIPEISLPFIGRLVTIQENRLAISHTLTLLKAQLDDAEHHGFLPHSPAQVAGQLCAHCDWNVGKVDEALGLLTALEKYRALEQLPGPLAELLRQGMRESIVRTIGLAATKGSDGGGNRVPDGSDLIDSLQDLGSFGVVAERFQKAAPLLRHTPTGTQWFRLLSSEACESLAWMDRVATTMYPEILPPLTRAAGGDATSRIEVVSKASADMLDAQRDNLLAFGRVAAPFVRLASGTRCNALRRWSGIVADVQRFDNKLPDNGVTVLDSFLRSELSGISPEKNCAEPPLRGVRDTPFYDARRRLARDASSVCRDSARDSLQSRYHRIARAFRVQLAGKFPFTDARPGAGVEATAEGVRAFYREFDANGGKLLIDDLQSSSCGAQTGTVAAFLRKADTARPLFLAILEQGLSLPLVDVSPEFRVNQGGEAGGAQIAEWQFVVGAQSLSLTDPPGGQLRWSGGMPVHLRLRFAKDTPVTPVVSATPNMRVSGRQVDIEYTGLWSLLSMIQGQATPAAELPGLDDNEPWVLRFNVPVNAGAGIPAVRVYVRLRLYAPGRKEPIRIASFPSEAPALPGCFTREAN